MRIGHREDAALEGVIEDLVDVQPVAAREGKVLSWVGASGDDEGRPVLARQQRGDGSSLPVEPWGVSWDDAFFEVKMTATQPEARGCCTRPSR